MDGHNLQHYDWPHQHPNDDHYYFIDTDQAASQYPYAESSCQHHPVYSPSHATDSLSFASPLHQDWSNSYPSSFSVATNSSQHHIHAPIPISSYSTLLPHLVSELAELPLASRSLEDPRLRPASRSPAISDPESPSMTSATTQSRSLSPTDNASPLEVYGNAPQVFFPPPCELLATLAEQDSRPRQLRSPSLHSCSKSRSTSRGTVDKKGASSSARAAQSHGGKIRSSTSNASIKNCSFVRKPQHLTPSRSVVALESPQRPRPENIRKVFFRTVQKFVGFKPTDPDTITSHEKKRHYLETLEEYVIWLHDYCDSIRHTPTPLERVDRYRELSSRSIRAMLVHYQDDAKCLYEELKGKNPECSLFEDSCSQATRP
ncbi:hypothetical protein BDY19DRAFT_914277 [Irpex rosettiformis]|uniref:Uncharacterized protein n=1 Tax=Irpex rosettiformis TaxID=378272 RepID=A0ACB8UKH3_9APHY|nr:hypothetical protein BDY19DRAFT_914277 [Irpex rosettiformis]